ncbi:MAG: acyl-CoA thioesterase II [Pseudomonadota bacterium]
MSAVDTLLKTLDLEPLEHNLFRGLSPQVGWQRVFGGQVIGQALVAATRTVPAERHAHSLHCYFMLAGDPKVPIIYQVDRLRDGKSFTTRRVTATQHGRAIFALSASFQVQEDGLDHHMKMPDNVPDPETLPTESELKDKFMPLLPEPVKKYWESERPIEMRFVDLTRYVSRQKLEPKQYIWIRATGKLPDDNAAHQAVLGYASDMTLLDSSLLAHGRSLFDKDLQIASLDHAMWFHRPFRADDWLLYAQDSPSASGARGFARGSIYARDGLLVASVAQEGLIRIRS